MPRDPPDSTIQLSARLPSPSPYLAGSITTLDLSLAAHYWAVSAQVPSMMFGKAERRISSAAWAICTNNPTARSGLQFACAFTLSLAWSKDQFIREAEQWGTMGTPASCLRPLCGG